MKEHSPSTIAEDQGFSELEDESTFAASPVIHGYGLGMGCDVSSGRVGLEFSHLSDFQIVESNVERTSNVE